MLWIYRESGGGGSATPVCVGKWRMLLIFQPRLNCVNFCCLLANADCRLRSPKKYAKHLAIYLKLQTMRVCPTREGGDVRQAPRERAEGEHKTKNLALY